MARVMFESSPIRLAGYALVTLLLTAALVRLTGRLEVGMLGASVAAAVAWRVTGPKAAIAALLSGGAYVAMIVWVLSQWSTWSDWPVE